MKAVQVLVPGNVSTSPLRLIEVSDPVPAPDELVLTVTACAVCRTDLQIVEGDLEARRLPIVPGHQAVGRVERLGRDVSRLGDRRPGGRGLARVDLWHVSVLPHEPREPLSAEPGSPAGIAMAALRRGSLSGPTSPFVCPAGFDDLAAAPLLCGGVIGYRSLKVSGIEPGGRLGLFGFGASALLALQVAVHWGCEVHVRTRSSASRARAGASAPPAWPGTTSRRPPLDAAVTFAPAGDVVIAALRVSIAAGRSRSTRSTSIASRSSRTSLLWLERSLRSVANFTRADAREFLALAAAIPIRTAVEPFPLEAANEALRRAATGELEATAVLVTS